MEYYANEIRPVVIISRCMLDDLSVLRFLGSTFPIVRIMPKALRPSGQGEPAAPPRAEFDSPRGRISGAVG